MFTPDDKNTLEERTVTYKCGCCLRTIWKPKTCDLIAEKETMERCPAHNKMNYLSWYEAKCFDLAIGEIVPSTPSIHRERRLEAVMNVLKSEYFNDHVKREIVKVTNDAYTKERKKAIQEARDTASQKLTEAMDLVEDYTKSVDAYEKHKSPTLLTYDQFITERKRKRVVLENEIS